VFTVSCKRNTLVVLFNHCNFI